MGFRRVNPSRSRLMSAVKSFGNRSTEQALRMALVRAKISGWHLHDRTLPGVPDFYFPRARFAVFVDGCFWHGCSRCRTIPKTRRSFWLKKISGNRARHQRVGRRLRHLGVRILRVWEHSLKRKCIAVVVAKIYQETSTVGGHCAQRS